MAKKKIVNEWKDRKPTRPEIAAAQRMAKKISPKLYKLMEARTVKNA